MSRKPSVMRSAVLAPVRCRMVLMPKVSLPVCSSKAAISVKVPPMSAASRRLEPLAVDGMRCFMFASATIARYAQRAGDESPPPVAGKGQGLASSAAEGETMLEGTVQEKRAWGGRSVRLTHRHAYERPPSRPGLTVGVEAASAVL